MILPVIRQALLSAKVKVFLELKIILIRILRFLEILLLTIIIYTLINIVSNAAALLYNQNEFQEIVYDSRVIIVSFFSVKPFYVLKIYLRFN
jgi:hypothetical protein